MAITPGIVSDWLLEVAAYTDGTEPTTYTRVYGITDYTPPGVSKNLEDDSDFDSGAWGSQTGTGLDYEISGTVKVPRAGLAVDPGQEILRAAGKSVGEDGYVHFRTIKNGAETGHKGVADASFNEGGGSRTDLTKAEFTLAGRGALATYTPA
jgi:hypothetical protein